MSKAFLDMIMMIKKRLMKEKNQIDVNKLTEELSIRYSVKKEKTEEYIHLFQQFIEEYRLLTREQKEVRYWMSSEVSIMNRYIADMKNSTTKKDLFRDLERMLERSYESIKFSYYRKRSSNSPKKKNLLIRDEMQTFEKELITLFEQATQQREEKERLEEIVKEKEKEILQLKKEKDDILERYIEINEMIESLQLSNLNG